MNYRTIWSYLRFSERVNNHIIMPQIVLEACLGKGEGAKLLTEIEGEILELLISGEQGALTINSITDLCKFICVDSYDAKSYALTNYSVESYRLFKKDSSLGWILKGLQNRGYVLFKNDFFII